ncbi:MAG: MinD/ParA family protein [Dethiobacteria bacterium]
MADQAQRMREIFQGERNFKAPRKSGLTRTFVVASGKGGVGKTNIVVNLALILGQWGQKIIILDTDLGMANVDILLDLQPRFTLIDVIHGRKDLQDVILKGPANIEIIPGGSGLSQIVNLDSQQREQLIARFSALEEKGGFLLVDCSAGLSRDVLSFIAAADELMLVTTPEPTAITDVYSIIKIVSNYGLHSRVNLIVNMAGSIRDGEKVFERIRRVCENFLEIEVAFLGGIEYDQSVQKAVLNCSPYVLQFPRSRATRCTRHIARRMLFGAEAPEEMPRKTVKKEGFLRRLLQLWRFG